MEGLLGDQHQTTHGSSCGERDDGPGAWVRLHAGQSDGRERRAGQPHARGDEAARAPSGSEGTHRLMDPVKLRGPPMPHHQAHERQPCGAQPDVANRDHELSNPSTSLAIPLVLPSAELLATRPNLR